jgi:ferredoxin
MANPKLRVASNVAGDFFVDSTCINCDTCRQIAPAVFGEVTDSSFVKAQPISNADRHQALQAVLACPTGSIGFLGDDDVKAVMQDFPLVIEEPVFYCGYNSPKSYGGNSYFIQASSGNWLIDSPKFVAPLVQRLEALGGVDHIFLTHRDEVADAERLAKPSHYSSGRVVIATGSRGRPRRRRSVGIGPRLPGDHDTRPHARALLLAIPKPLPLHRGPHGLG